MAANVVIASLGTQRALLIAHNEEHRSGAFTSVAHADGAEWTAGSSPVEQVIPTTLSIAAAPTYGTATGLDHALRIFNEAQRLHNLHITYHNRGVASGTPCSYSSLYGYVGYNVYAHKAAEASSTTIDPDRKSVV